MKKLRNIFIFTLAFIFLAFNKTAKAEVFQRANSFVKATGATKVAEIKRFQAMHNIAVTGTLDKLTKEMLNNPDYQDYDSVKNPPSSGRWIVVNKTKRILTVYNGIWPEVKYPVAIGTSKTPTPSTKATIIRLSKNPAWGGMMGKYKPTAADDPQNPLGERWMGLKIPGMSGYGIHGTIKPWEIGKNVSNGCIRMFNYDIENYVFPKMYSGAPVWIGTDEELASWGVHQYVDKISNNQSTKPAEEKPVEEQPTETKPTEEKPVETKPAEESPIYEIDPNSIVVPGN